MTAAAHVHACRGCTPDLFLGGRRQGEGHVAVRFHDEARQPKPEIYLNGQKLEACTEAVAGPTGMVWEATSIRNGRKHFCPCGARRLCEQRRTGSVEIRTAGVPETSEVRTA